MELEDVQLSIAAIALKMISVRSANMGSVSRNSKI